MLGHYRVSGTGQYHSGRQFLVTKDPFDLAHEEIIACYVDGECLTPLRFRQFAIRARVGIDGRSVYDAVNPAEPEHGEPPRLRNSFRRAKVEPSVGHVFVRGNGSNFPSNFFRAFYVLIGNDDVSTLFREQQRHLSTDATTAAHNEDNFAAELRLRRHALKLGFFKSPVLDAKRL